MRREIFRPACVALPQLYPRRSKRARKLRALEKRARGGDENPEVTLTNSLESLDSFSGDFSVCLGLAEALARRVERNQLGFDERRQVRQPALGACNVVIHDDEEAGCIVGKRSEHHGVARSVQATDRAPIARRRHLIKKSSELSERFDDGEQLRERHGAR